MVGVVAHQRRHVERRRQPRLAVLEQIAETLVGLLRRAKTGELAHRPQPPAIHRRVHAARERKLAREADPLRLREIVGRIQRLDRLSAQSREQARRAAVCAQTAHETSARHRSWAGEWWPRGKLKRPPCRRFRGRPCAELAQAERRGPREVARAQAAARVRHEVLAHAAALDRLDHAEAELRGRHVIAVVVESECAQPGDVGPDGAAPVVARRPVGMLAVERAHAVRGGERAARDQVAHRVHVIAAEPGRQQSERRAGARHVERGVVGHVDRADQPVGVRAGAQGVRHAGRGGVRLLGDTALAQLLRQPAEVGAGAGEDRGEAGVEHAEGAAAREARLGPGDSRAAPDQREEAAVVLVARALGRVDRIGVAPVHHGHLGHDAPERPVPFEGVVATRLPRVDQHRLARPARVALLEQEAMPAEQRREQGARAPLVRVALEQEPGAGGGHRRLRDPRDAPAVGAEPPPPPARAGQVAGVGPRHRRQRAAQAAVHPVRHAGVEGDVRNHPVLVAASGERLELAPGAGRVELGPAERRQRRVPVPLVRVGGARRDRVAAVVVSAQHVLRAHAQIGCRKLDHVSGHRYRCTRRLTFVT